MDSQSPIERALGPQLAALHALERRTRELALVSAHRRAQASRRIEALEHDLARVALVVRAIADLAIAKGLFTDAELRRQFDEADFADGVFDAELDPKLVAPGTGRGATPARATKPKAKAKPRRKTR